MKGIFADLANFEAWKEIEKWIEEECERSMKAIDNTEVKNLNINRVCEERGYRNGLRKVLREVRQRAEGR